MPAAADPKKLLRIGGWLLAAASLAFLVIAARERHADIAALSLSGAQWLRIGGLAIGYGLSLFVLAGAWHCLLEYVGAAPDSARISIRSFTTSQLAKYVPGNVFHYLGRHMMLRAQGLAEGRLVLASFVEIVLMLVAAGLVVLGAAVFSAPGPFDAAAALPGWARAAVFAAILAAAVTGATLAARRFGGGHPRWLLGALGAYLAFFCVMGAIIAAILAMLSDAPPFLVAGGGVAAWMAGFATPGAPAGIGTREAAMVLFVGNSVPQAAIILGAGLFRLVTLAGDVVCFALGWVLVRDNTERAATGQE